MVFRDNELVLLIVLFVAISIFTIYSYPVIGYASSVVILSSTIAFSSVSILVGLRRYFFLAGATSHISLASLLAAIATVNIFTSNIGWILVVAVIVCTGLTSLVGYMVRRGVDKDAATAIIVSLSASLSVVLAYLIENYYVSTTIDVESLIWGDPLLVSQVDAIASFSTAIVSVVVMLLTYKAHALIGVDYDIAKTSGVNIGLYDGVLYVLLGVVLSSLLRIVGFILEHVLVLMPSSIALLVASSTKKIVWITLYVSLLASLIGTNLSVALDLSPSGTIGIIFGLFYIVVLWRRKIISG